MLSANFRLGLVMLGFVGLLGWAAPASATVVLNDDFSAYASGTYLSATGWTMATHYISGTGHIQITNTSGLAPASAITGSTAGGRGGYVAAYRNFTSSVPAGSSLVLTEQLYLRPNTKYAEIGFWDGTVAGGGNGDPQGIRLEIYGNTIDLDQNYGGWVYFGPSVITQGIYSVTLHADAPSETTWATIVTPDNQTYTSPAVSLAGTSVAAMTGVQIYCESFGGSQADYGNIVVDAVPEPASLGLVTLGCLGLVSRRRSATARA